jgi:hypothetical protein
VEGAFIDLHRGGHEVAVVEELVDRRANGRTWRSMAALRLTTRLVAATPNLATNA